MQRRAWTGDVPDRLQLLGQGKNTAQAFITLKDWSRARPERFRRAHRRRHEQAMSQSIRDAKISALQPPPIDNLGNSTGFSFRLQDRGQKGYAELMRGEGSIARGRGARARCCRRSMSKGCRRRRRSN